MFTFLILSIVLQTHASEKTFFEQTMESAGDVVTQERWVEYGGSQYREVEYNGTKYYIKMTSRQGEFAELNCEIPAQQNPHLISASASMFHRTKMFASFLTESCVLDARGKKRTSVALDPRIGVTFPDNPKSLIKDKSVFWNPLASPLLNLGFAGTW